MADLKKTQLVDCFLLSFSLLLYQKNRITGDSRSSRNSNKSTKLCKCSLHVEHLILGMH